MTTTHYLIAPVTGQLARASDKCDSIAGVEKFPN
jgi:hypothetical protein